MSKVPRRTRTTMQGQSMSSVAIARKLEEFERDRAGSKPAARRNLAGKLKIGIGTLENIIRDRVKSVDERVRDRLQALLVEEYKAEITRLTHELEIARQSGVHLDSDQVGEIEAHLHEARALLEGKPG